MDKLKSSTKKYWAVFRELTEKNDLLLSLLIAVSVIAIATFIGWYNNKVVLGYPYPHFHYQGHNVLGFLSNWDGVNYLYIARHGYANSKLASFYPLYPVLIKGLDYIVPSYLISSLLISWFSLVGAIFFYIKILRHLKVVVSQSEAVRAVLFF